MKRYLCVLIIICTFGIHYCHGDVKVSEPELQVTVGKNVSVNCSAENCESECRFTWNGCPGDRYYAMFTISNVERNHTDIYVCTAITGNCGNVFGIATFNLTVVDAPDPPLNIQITNQTAASLIVTWDIGSNGGLEQNYFLSLSPGDMISQRIDKQERIKVLDGLNASTNYTVSMYANNDIGNSSVATDSAFTKAKPGASDLFAVTPLENVINVLMAFANADGVTEVNISCCIQETTDENSCTYSTASTDRASYVLMNVSYPSGGTGKYNINATLYDGGTLVQTFNRSTMNNYNESANRNGALLGSLAAMSLFGIIATVCVVAVIIEKRKRINRKDRGNDSDNVKCDSTGFENKAQTPNDDHESEIISEIFENDFLSSPDQYVLNQDHRGPNHHILDNNENRRPNHYVLDDDCTLLPKQNISHNEGLNPSKHRSKHPAKQHDYNSGRKVNTHEECSVVEDNEASSSTLNSDMIPDYENIKFKGTADRFVNPKSNQKTTPATEPTKESLSYQPAEITTKPRTVHAIAMEYEHQNKYKKESNSNLRNTTQPTTAKKQTNVYEALNKRDQLTMPNIYTVVKTKEN